MNHAAGVADGLAVGTIETDDPLPGAWRVRFGRAVVVQALDGNTARMAVPRTPRRQGTIAGQSVDFSGSEDGGPAHHEPSDRMARRSPAP